MDNVDWNAWMKKNHVKIYTEEELRRKKLRDSARKMLRLAKKAAPLLKAIQQMQHA